MATVWRWPPESEAIGMRTLGMRMDSVSQQLAGAALHLDLVEDAALLQLAAEEEVADDIEVVAQREVLVDGRDAQVPGRRAAG